MPALLAQPKEFIRPDFHVVALREEGWNIDEADKQYIEVMETVYFFNRNEVTYCCEVTPSYALLHLQYRVVLTEAGHALREAENGETELDRLYSKYEQGPVDEQVIYWHVSAMDAFINRIAESGEMFRHGVYGDPNPELSETEYREWLEDNDLVDTVREAISANSVI